MIRYTYATIRNKASNKVAKANAGKSNIQKLPVIWFVLVSCDGYLIDFGDSGWATLRLGTHAFHTILSRKPQNYSLLLKSLSFELSLPRHRRCRRRFRNLVKEGLAGIVQISFWVMFMRKYRDYSYHSRSLFLPFSMSRVRPMSCRLAFTWLIFTITNPDKGLSKGPPSQDNVQINRNAWAESHHRWSTLSSSLDFSAAFCCGSDYLLDHLPPDLTLNSHIQLVSIVIAAVRSPWRFVPLLRQSTTIQTTCLLSTIWRLTSRAIKLMTSPSWRGRLCWW